MDVMEWDPAVLHSAELYFGFKTSHRDRVFIGDAYELLLPRKAQVAMMVMIDHDCDQTVFMNESRCGL